MQYCIKGNIKGFFPKSTHCRTETKSMGANLSKTGLSMFVILFANELVQDVTGRGAFSKFGENW